MRSLALALLVLPLAACAVQHAKENMKAARSAYDQCLDAHAPALVARHLPDDQAARILMAECRNEGEAYQDAVADLNDAERNDVIRRQNAVGAAAVLHQMGQDTRARGSASTQHIDVTVTPWNGGPPPPP